MRCFSLNSFVPHLNPSKVSKSKDWCSTKMVPLSDKKNRKTQLSCLEFFTYAWDLLTSFWCVGQAVLHLQFRTPFFGFLFFVGHKTLYFLNDRWPVPPANRAPELRNCSVPPLDSRDHHRTGIARILNDLDKFFLNDVFLVWRQFWFLDGSLKKNILDLALVDA